jgi:hypothetical protein
MTVVRFMLFALAAATINIAGAQGPTTIPFDKLTGAFSRPDGGYTIVIKSVAPDGKLDATYYNPRPLPFEKAQATRDGKTFKVFLELTAGGYNGSTYTLTYDPESDQLKGVYYQAVQKQSYEVFFVRK